MTVSLLVEIYCQANNTGMAPFLALTPGLPTCRWASASPYRLPRNAGGQITSFRTFYDFLEGPLLHNFLSGKTRKVVNFLERNSSTTNSKDKKSRGEVEDRA